jgi:hypothetical protein
VIPRVEGRRSIQVSPRPRGDDSREVAGSRRSGIEVGEEAADTERIRDARNSRTALASGRRATMLALRRLRASQGGRPKRLHRTMRSSTPARDPRPPRSCIRRKQR